MTNYRLESTDPATGIRERMSLSASSDAQAIEQMEAVRWRHENAGERRLLVLERADGGERAVVARLGSRRFEGVREVSGEADSRRGQG